MAAAFVRVQCGCLWERGRPARGLPRRHVLGLYLNHRDKEKKSFWAFNLFHNIKLLIS